MSIALFPGSFDPFSSGHEAIARRALALFDKLYIAVGVNTDKEYMLSVEERTERIRAIFGDDPRVQTMAYSGMTVDACHEVGAKFIVRGVRNEKDFLYEQWIATVNRQLAPDIDTVLLMADDKMRDVSSTILREKMAHKNDA